MEYLTTPDVGAQQLWRISTPKHSTTPIVTTKQLNPSTPIQDGNQHNHSSIPTSTSLNPNHNNNDATPMVPGSVPQLTPRFPNSTPFFPSLDRAGIKNSFQSLFSPNPNATTVTPQLLRPNFNTPGMHTGVTPFINGINTPNLIAPPTNMLPTIPNSVDAHHLSPSKQNPNASPEQLLSSPYLQAAAKEAVRREFLNMPTYVSTNSGIPTNTSPIGSSERVVPMMQYTSSPDQPQVSTSTGAHVSSPTTPKLVSPNSGDAKVPKHDADGKQQTNQLKSSTTSQSQPQVHVSVPFSAPQVSHGIPTTSQSMPQMQAQPQPQIAPFFVPHTHGPPPPGMMVIGQHPHMMLGPHPGAIYAPPPGMVMFPGGPTMFPQPGMMVPPNQGGDGHGPATTVKPESSVDRKVRIEHEKQELIREFKKKTREAALVRFRQKRRERRFGKLIRYDCRKKLADARPRVKGRFVRVKNGEGEEDEISEGAQIVPELQNS